MKCLNFKAFSISPLIARRLSVSTLFWAIAVCASPATSSAETQTVYTDADTYGVIICRNDAPFNFWCDGSRGKDQFVKVHDQNALVAGYWHFDLSEVDAGMPVEEARLQLDTQTNSYGETTVSVFAIADPAADWDLDNNPERRLNGIDAPFSDYESYAWTGDVGGDGQQRFNSPTPFLEEGTQADSRVRLLKEGIIHADQDLLTNADGNAFGGHINFNESGGPGEPGSANGNDNTWPVKNAVDIDVTELINWKLGHNPSYSDFDPSDHELTVMIRTDFQETGLPNGFVRYIARESRWTRQEGDLQLHPARIVLSNGITEPCDFNRDGSIDAADIDLIFANIGQGNLSYDLDGDGMVSPLDVDVLVEEKLNTWFGDANLDGEFNSGDFVSVFHWTA